jgi:WD40 repeat protein
MHQFLREHALHWMEAMSWMGKISEAIEAMITLESIAEVKVNVGNLQISRGEECKISQDLIQECKRFLMYARSGVEQAPLQVYVSAALFTPSSTLLREIGEKTTLVSYVKRSPPMPEHWSALLLTLDGHSLSVNAVQFSPDGSKLASASADDKVMVWDSSTGAHLHTLEGHSSLVKDVQFSPGGSKLASASYDGKVMVWDTSTPAHMHTLEGHSDRVNAVQFSPDGSKLASASADNNVMVWNSSTGAHLQTLEGHSSSVGAVQFSPDDSKLASASDDGKVMVSDLNKLMPMESIDVNGYVPDLECSADGFYLDTVTGSSKLKSAVGVSHDENACLPHFQVGQDWILWQGLKTIWLPPELRPYGSAASIYGALMACGHSSGTVSFWEIHA